MKCLFVLAAFMAAAPAFAQTTNDYFLSAPCLSPDGQAVVFSLEGDLWKSGTKGGSAVRLTGMEGYETDARFSPDGKWIAFTGRQSGNADVYVMPAGGGNVKQLTFNSGPDVVSAWSWDSKSIYFSSDKMGQVSGYKVSIAGGTSQRVFGNYFFQYDHNLVPHPLTGEIFFNDTWESDFQVSRKRYKGPFNPDIQSYNPVTKQYKRYTDWEGKDFFASIDKTGNIYFISDEANGEYNLYTFTNEKKTALTHFSSSIKTPLVNANGGSVVFEKDYQLWLYDVKAGKAEKINIDIVRNNVLPREKDYEVRGAISAFDISPDAKKMAFISRGELFVSDVEGKFIREINRGSAERVSEVKWLADNKTLLFSQTLDGYQNWYTIAADGSTALKQLTSDKGDNRSVTFNKDKTKAVYYSGRNEVRIMDLKTFESKTIAKDEIWIFNGSVPVFSPGDEYIAFTAHRDFEEDIFLYNTKDNKTINLTNTGIMETSPLWSADGKYIYFTSARLKPSYPFGPQNSHVYRVALEKLDEPYRYDKYNELFKEEKKDTTQKDTVKKDSTKKDSTQKTAAAKPPVVTVDMDGLMDRLELISPSFGGQQLLGLLQKDNKTTVLYGSNHSEGRNALWKTVLEPFENPKTEKIAGTEGGSSDIAGSGDKYFILQNGTINKLNLDANKLDPVSISFTFRRNLQAEFSQMFYETWAQVEENYYDEHFHGVDWKKIKSYYAQFLPYMSNRSDIRTVLNDMLGELNSSHQGFYTFGSDEAVSLRSVTMETGILFDNEAPYTVKHVARRSNADKKGIDVQPGDILEKVNDETVDKNIDRDYYFTRPSPDREIRLTFNRNGRAITVNVHPQRGLGTNLYDEWIDNNQEKVDEKGKGRIAYTCMKNMGTGELDNFIVDMTRDFYHKDALILDLRYNTGGNVHDEVLRFLSQRSYLQWKYREGKLTRQGNFTPADKPIVLLINEQSLSDAEMTSQGFKALKLGTIIGNETYRWIIFTSGTGLVDGSFVRLPSWGCYTLDGKDLESTGVQPDIKVINTFEDKINGKDPQLDRAIAEILKQLK